MTSRVAKRLKTSPLGGLSYPQKKKKKKTS